MVDFAILHAVEELTKITLNNGPGKPHFEDPRYVAREFSESNLNLLGKINKKICFVETYTTPVLPGNTDPIIKDSVLSRTEKNVFLMEDSVKDSFFIGPISVNPDLLCISPRNNILSLQLESKGNFVSIS